MSTSFQLEGRCELVCGARASGESFLREQAVRAPFHVSKPYWDGHALIVQCVNATAGVFSGDRLECRATVGPGARMLLTSPSAHRIHTMPEGEARYEQAFTVRAGGHLEVMPELFIPQAGCRYVQRTSIEVEEGGELFFVETLAPGRVASGESFAFDRVAWSLDVRVAGEDVLRERYVLRPGDESLWSLRRGGTDHYYASCLVVTSARFQPPPVVDAVWMGASRLPSGGWTVRMLAPDSRTLRAALRAVRESLRPALPALAADPRKL